MPNRDGDQLSFSLPTDAAADGRICRGPCRSWKPASAFRRRESGKLYPVCRRCEAAVKRAWDEARRERERRAAPQPFLAL
jgi:hypothetical protein